VILHVDASVRISGDGSADRPYKTIGEAAAVAVAGDEVLVMPGIYREHVNPPRGGTDDRHRIVYRSAVKHGAVITGAERIDSWEQVEGDVWRVAIDNGLFGDYNPYTTRVKGDWFNAECIAHTGEVYLNDKSLYEVTSLDAVLHPKMTNFSWDPEFTVYTWYTEQANGQTVIYANFQGADPNVETVEINVRRNCFYPTREGRGYITLSGFTVTKAATTWAPPTAYQEGMIGPHWSKGWIIEDCEVSHSKCSGISLGKYLQPNNENKWTTRFFKDGTQTERDAICQAQLEGWTKENIGSHIIRRCEIHDCGQTGIVGHLGGVFSVIEDNHIHHINNKQNLAGAEIGGIKMHAAIDVVYRRNHIHHCTRGLWLDWQAQGTRVTQNLFHDNVPPVCSTPVDDLALGEDIFVEVSHGPTLIDNNILLSACACRLCTQGLAFVHNLIAGSFTYVGQGTDNGGVKFPTPRYTPYHVPHRTEVAGFMTFLHGDARFYNNIFVQLPVREDLNDKADAWQLREKGLVQYVVGTKPYDGYPTAEEYFSRFTTYFKRGDRDIYYDHLPLYCGGNVYIGGAAKCDADKDGIEIDEAVRLDLVEQDGVYRLETDLYDKLSAWSTAVVTTETLGEAFEPEQKFESSDGTPIIFDADFFDRRRTSCPMPGPFAAAQEANAVLTEK